MRPKETIWVAETRDALTITGDASGGLEELLRDSFARMDRVAREGAAIDVAHPRDGSRGCSSMRSSTPAGGSARRSCG